MSEYNDISFLSVDMIKKVKLKEAVLFVSVTHYLMDNSMISSLCVE